MFVVSLCRDLPAQAIAAMDNMRESLKCFSGDGGEDISIWLKKVNLVAKIKKIEDVVSLIPLYLEGAAFAVYDQMAEDKKMNKDDVEKVLLTAFTQNNFGAYDSLRLRSWCPGESVDVFLSDIRRLVTLAGIDSEQTVRCAFICGLPADVSNQLRASAQINNQPLDVVVTQARVLMSVRVHSNAMVAVSDSPAPGEKRHGQGARRKLECFECGGDHLARVCKNKKPFACWTCGENGHISRNCTSASGNSQGELPAQTAPRRL